MGYKNLFSSYNNFLIINFYKKKLKLNKKN